MKATNYAQSNEPGRAPKDRMKNPFPPGSPEAFFFTHSGWSYDPKKETAKQGRMRCARDSARAERHAEANDWEYRWESDWSVGSHKEFFGKGSAYEEREPDTCETCLLMNAEGEVLECLGCVDDADQNYRRVVEAELASEAYHREVTALLREFEMGAFINRNFAL